jgi:hypothetical protein
MSISFKLSIDTKSQMEYEPSLWYNHPILSYWLGTEKHPGWTKNMHIGLKGIKAKYSKILLIYFQYTRAWHKTLFNLYYKPKCNPTCGF